MKITTSELYAALDQCEEIVFTETEQLIALGHILFTELSSIGLHPAEVSRLTGATLNYYQRADQYQFSTDNQILYSGTEQDCYSVWSSIGKGLTKAAAATTRVTAGTKKSLSAGFNKARANFRTNGWKSTFKGVGTRMGQGYNLGFKTKLAQQTQNLAKSNATNAVGKMKSVASQMSDMRKAGTLTQGKLSMGAATNRNLAGVTTSQDRIANMKGAGSRSQILKAQGNVQKTANALSEKGSLTQHVNKTQANLADPKFGLKPEPKAPTPPQQGKYRPFQSGDRGINGKGIHEARENGGNEFMARMRNSKGNIMGINTKDGFKKNMANIGNWAASNKVQAGVVAAGTAALGYGAYRMLRGPRQQPQQQQQPVVINNNQ